LQEEVRRNWGRKAAGVLICLGIGWGVYTEALSLVSRHFARITADARPNLSVIPQPVPDTSIVKLDGVRVARFGFSFQVPLKDVDQDGSAKGTAAVVTFRDGGGLLVFNPATQTDGAKIMRGASLSQRKTIHMSGVHGEMIGGWFDQHPWSTFNAPIINEDPDFPAVRHLPKHS
jgi:hypothetical protein